MDRLPLDGVRVLDFTIVWAGPHVTEWLGVMGADVIKVESNLRPDLTRSNFRPSETGINLSAEFAALNYGKRSCTLNMTKQKARDLVKEIVKMCDVVTENFGGPVLNRWGLGYSDLKEVKPDIILYSGSGFGRTGPYKDIPAFAGIVEAFGGLVALNGYPGGEPSPMATRGYADMLAAQHGAFAILAALHHRSETGEGQHIDLSMTEVVAAFLPEAIMDFTMNGRVHVPQGNRDLVMAPHGCYRCRGDDEWVTIAVSSDEDWRALCEATGNPQWAEDGRFADILSRQRNGEELDVLIQEWTVNHSHYEVAELLQEAGVMAAPSLKVEEGLLDPQLTDRGFFKDIDHPGIGPIRLAGLPWRLNDVPPGLYIHCPDLGEHNEYVFKELLHLTDDEIAQLVEEEVIY